MYSQDNMHIYFQLMAIVSYHFHNVYPPIYAMETLKQAVKENITAIC